MFGKLKNKLKEWTAKVSEVEGEEEIIEETIEEVKEETKKKPKEKNSKEKKKKKEETKLPKEIEKETTEETPEEEIEEKLDTTTKEEKKGFFKKMFSKKEKIEEDIEENPEEETTSERPEGEKPIKEILETEKTETKEDKPKTETKASPFKKKENKPKETELEKETKSKEFMNDGTKEGGRTPSDAHITNVSASRSESTGSKKIPKQEKEGEVEEKLPSNKEEEIIEDKQTPPEEELPSDQEIDKKLKEELKKGDYKEPEKTFNNGMETFTPDLEKTIKETKPKKSFFSKLSSKKTISEEEFEEYSEDLEMILLENNVALEVTDRILEQLKEKIVGVELSKKEIQETIENSLKEIVEDVLIEPFDIIEEIKAKEGPYVMIFCGINGVGKTTQIAKFAHMLKEKGITSVMAAGDTFRAAAVEQLQTHGKNLDIKVIAHDYGTDPASVGFDAMKYAEKNNIKVVLIDTAGRIHTAVNLLKEMQKIKRVCKPDRTIFVGESITGNDAVDQLKAFNDNIGIDGIFLSKADIDEKGGTALSVGYVTGKPIIYLGTGQNYEDIEPFDKKKFIEKLGLGEE
jgi:fused signal recognition particle receptor